MFNACVYVLLGLVHLCSGFVVINGEPSSELIGQMLTPRYASSSDVNVTCDYKYNVLPGCTTQKTVASLAAPVTVQDCMANCRARADCDSFFFWNVGGANNGCHLYSAPASQCADTSKPEGGNTAFYDKACDVGPISCIAPKCNYKYNVLPTCSSQKKIASLTAPVSVQDCMANCRARADCDSFFFWNVGGTNNGCHLYSAPTSQCADTSKPEGGNTAFYDRTCDVGPVSAPKCNYKYNVLPTCTNQKRIATLPAPVSVQDCMANCRSRADCDSFFFWNAGGANNGCHLYSAPASQCADTSKPEGGNTAFYDKACDVGPISCIAPKCNYKYNVLPTCSSQKSIASLTAPVSVQDCMANCQSRADCDSFFFWNVGGSNNGCHLYSASTSQCADTSKPEGGNTAFYDRTCDVGPVSAPRCDYKYNVLPTCTNQKRIATLAAPVSVQDCMSNCRSRADCNSFFFWNVGGSNNGCHLYSAPASQCADTSKPEGGNTAFYDRACAVGVGAAPNI